MARSGFDRPASHLETAPTVTPTASASCSWVSPAALRKERMFSAILIFMLSPSADDCSIPSRRGEDNGWQNRKEIILLLVEFPGARLFPGLLWPVARIAPRWIAINNTVLYIVYCHTRLVKKNFGFDFRGTGGLHAVAFSRRLWYTEGQNPAGRRGGITEAPERLRPVYFPGIRRKTAVRISGRWERKHGKAAADRKSL